MGAAQAPAAEPLDIAADAVRETHCSRVLLQGDKAYKIRKSVRFAFVDQSTAAARRRLAEEEVRLNRELAPDTYLGVVDVRALGGQREPAVVMRRWDEADTLAARVARGTVAAGDLERLGRRLAAFHAAAPVVRRHGGAPATLARVDRTAEELWDLVGPELGAAAWWRATRGLQAAVVRRGDELERRAAAGRWRDGHGDLRADHVVFGHRDVRVVDRLEFDAALRADDVGSDLAFLLMDLEARRARPAAQEVLAAYREAGGDPGDDGLLAVWGAFRATVAAKVALLWAAQTRDAGVVARARNRMALAGRLVWRARGPLVVVVCGAPATGKSTIAAEVEARAGLPVVSTDLVRKELLGVAPAEPAPADAYAAEATGRVYDEVGRRAAAASASAGGAIVDGSMRSPALRGALCARLAGTRCVWVECRTPAGIAAARATARARAGASASDADAAVAARLRALWQPLDEVPARDHVVLRGDRPAAEAVDELEARLDALR